MKNHQAQNPQTTRRLRLITCAVALAVAFTASPQPLAHADHVTPPPVPSNIQVPAGNKAFLEGHAVGTQNYICLPSESGFAWTLFGPQATLFNDRDKQIITHFLSEDPSGTRFPTWQHSRDTSTIWAMPISSSPGGSGAIPLLLLEVVETEPGPTGGERLSRTTFIQRLNTSEGVAPSTGCSLSTDVGKRALVPYTADYFLYKEEDRGDDHDDED